MARFFQVTAAEQSEDVRWDSFTTRRFNLAGLGWSFVAFIPADSKAEAEELFREDKRFRKIARQTGADWRTMFVLVEATTQRKRIS